MPCRYNSRLPRCGVFFCSCLSAMAKISFAPSRSGTWAAVTTARMSHKVSTRIWRLRPWIHLAASLMPVGGNNKTISQDTGLCEDTVVFWRKHWLEGGADLEKPGGKPKLLREAVSQLLADKPRRVASASLRQNKSAGYWRWPVKRHRSRSALLVDIDRTYCGLYFPR